MKRFLLLVVCIVATFGVVPASAECLDSVDSGYLCAGESGPFEACVYSWTGDTVRNWNDACADTNSDAWSDFYTEADGEFHSFDVYLDDGYLQTYARVATVCTHAEYDISSSYYNAGTC